MRIKSAILVLLVMLALTLAAGCSAANDVLAPSDPPSDGAPIADVEAPADSPSLGGGQVENTGAIAQQ